MARKLIVRNIDPAIVQALKESAATHDQSTEAEHREILARALAKPAPRSFKEALVAIPNVGTDEDFNFRSK